MPAMEKINQLVNRAKAIEPSLLEQTERIAQELLANPQDRDHERTERSLEAVAKLRHQIQAIIAAYDAETRAAMAVGAYADIALPPLEFARPMQLPALEDSRAGYLQPIMQVARHLGYGRN